MIGNKLTNKKGFSLLEIIIAISIFAISILVITQIFLKVNEAQRNVIAAQNVQENLKYAFEVMAKEIRNPIRASDSSCISSGSVYEETGNTSFSFINQYGQCVTYEIQTDGNGVSRLAITRGAQSQVYVTPDDIELNSLWFSVDETGQPKVTIAVDVRAIGKDIDAQAMKIQTTISARLYD